MATRAVQALVVLEELPDHARGGSGRAGATAVAAPVVRHSILTAGILALLVRWPGMARSGPDGEAARPA